MEDDEYEPEELSQVTDWRSSIQRYTFAPRRKQITYTNKQGTIISRQVWESSDSKLDIALRGLVDKLQKFSTVDNHFGDKVAMYAVADRYRDIINLQSANLTLVAAAIFIIEWVPTEKFGQMSYNLNAKLTPSEWPKYVNTVRPFLTSFFRNEPKEIALEASLLRTIELIRISLDI